MGLHNFVLCALLFVVVSAEFKVGKPVSREEKASFSNFEVTLLNTHNEYRRKHGVPFLKLNPQITAFAQEWADYLAENGLLDHRQNNDYGENLYGSFGETITGKEAAKGWYDEIKMYDFNRPGFSMETGHFTQLIWKNSKELGCGKALGNDGWTYIVCNYNPPGNYMKQFKQNVLPPL